jgi:ADP-heptose:LPS heptosyltransferase
MRRLLIRPGAIGDVIVSLPALEHLKADHTKVWVPSALVPLIQFADKVVSIAASRIDVLPEGFGERLRGFDEVVSWYGSNRDALSALHPRCIFHAALPPQGDRDHATDFYAKQVGAPLGLAPKIAVNASIARETIVIHPFSGGARKNWPLASYQALAEKLPLPVEWAQDRFESLLDLAEWIAGARLYIGNDSGITHLAAAVGVPTLALFGPTDPRVWAPRGATVVQNAELDEVLAAANRLLCSR